MKKRLLACIIAVAMALESVPVSASEVVQEVETAESSSEGYEEETFAEKTSIEETIITDDEEKIVITDDGEIVVSDNEETVISDDETIETEKSEFATDLDVVEVEEVEAIEELGAALTKEEINDPAVQKGIKKALSVVKPGMTNFQKIIVLHDYLCITCTYSADDTKNIRNFYGAFVEGIVCCEGFAKAYQYLLEQVGIECLTVITNDKSHCWNLVKLDGEWFHVDVTQDNNVGETGWDLRHIALLTSNSKRYGNMANWYIWKGPGWTKWTGAKTVPTSTRYDDAPWKDQMTPITFDEESAEEPSKTEETPVTETYKITYELNGGTNHPNNPTTYTSGEGSAEFKDPTREGYTFDGWYLRSDFAPNSERTSLPIGCIGDRTLYAKWTKMEAPEEESSEVKETSKTEESSETEESKEITKAETYTITYVLDGGINNPENPATYAKGQAVTFKDPTKEGYQFEGWYTKNGARKYGFSETDTNNKTVYAKWTKIETSEESSEVESPKTEESSEVESPKTEETPTVKSYKVTFNTNGHGTAPASYTVTENTTITRPAAPTADGYRFDGWYKNAACTKAWDFDSDVITANTTLYAKWVYVGTGELDARDIPDMVYTGSACKPEVDVYDDGTLLNAGKDYTVKYYNNINANSVLKSDTFNASLPYVEITGKGNYAGTVKVNFNILKASISDENANPSGDVTLKITNTFVTSNKPKKPFSSIKYLKSMKEGTDFTLRLTNEEGRELTGAVIPANVEGRFLLEIIGKNNYEGVIETYIYVADKASLPKTVKLTAGSVNVEGITDKAYTGKALVQDNVRLNVGGTQLVQGVDYAVSYAKNVNKGTATMTFKGIGLYTGSFKKTFKIAAADINTASHAQNLSAVYSKAGAKPAVVLTNPNGKRLVSGKDYTLSYTDNKAVGSGTITVKGKGNYAGTFSVPFSIAKADLNSLTVKTTSVAYNAKKAADYEYRPVIKLMDGNAALKAGVDYNIEYRNNTQAAYEAYRNGGADIPQAVITAAAGSAYELDGEIVIPLPVYQNKFTKNSVSVKVEQSECVYTGRQVKPSVKVSFMGKELVEGVDYMVSYGTNNVSGKNKGSVTITGIGVNYGGDMTVKFEIGRKTIIY